MKKMLFAAAAVLTATAATAQMAPPPPPAAPGAPLAQRDRVATRTEAVERVRTMFQLRDTNRDGYLVQAEMQAARGQRMADRQERRVERRADPQRQQAMFDRLDTDRNNVISRDEFARGQTMRIERRVMRGPGQGRMAMRGMNRMGGGMMLRMADANRDNRVSLQEATNAALQRFDRADVNRDGRVTMDERRQARMQMRQMRMGQPPAPAR